MEMRIKLEIGDKCIELDETEAEAVYALLKKVLGKNDTVVIPSYPNQPTYPSPQPWSPYNPIYPWWDGSQPHTICGASTGQN